LGFFYNPNIHPYREYRKRLLTVRDFSARAGLDIEYRDEYDIDDYMHRIIGKGNLRCESCYRMRLDATGAAARKNGATLMTTTLLYSKYQKHDVIIGIGKEMASEHGVGFYYEDFRKGWQKGIDESRRMGLYRQQYCGCLYSEQERYAKCPGFTDKGL